jgi:hypothetical protein
MALLATFRGTSGTTELARKRLTEPLNSGEKTISENADNG